jgi:hypothetical protein
MFILPKGVLAATKTADDAKQLVVNWLKREQRPLGATMGQQAKAVQTFRDDKGEPMYHVVYLDPSGFVIVPADDLVEPIIAFASQGRFDPSTDNPLGVFISSDVPARVAHARGLRAPPGENLLKARNKWQALLQGFNGDTNSAPAASTLSSLSDMRVAPFVQTLWNQGTANNGLACYNYYTPPYAAGTTSNYPCGCVPTSLAQLLAYFQYPTTGVGTWLFSISIDGTNTSARLRGGDGAGGPYCWSNMPPNPDNPTVAQCQAIGALTYDCGVCMQTGYGPGGSGAASAGPAYALVQTFMYNNAILGCTADASVFDPSLVTMVNANLDARLPVGVALNGHNVVCDGYGYNSSTLYNHMNMGWGGEDNAWYTLPMVDGFTNVWYFIYNIYPNASGEIVSGRVMSGGLPLANATVTAARVGGEMYTATTDTNGIYALAAIPSASQYTITVSLTNFITASTNCATGTSQNGGTNSGNVWGVNFSLVPAAVPPLIMTEPLDQLTVAGRSVNFALSALSQNSMCCQWQVQTAGNPGWINLSNNACYSGSQSASLLANVPDTSMNGDLFRCIVTNSWGSTTSSVVSLTVYGYWPDCAIPAPTGLVSWWTGNLTAYDFAGTNNGTLSNGVTYVPGEVGYGFSLDGTNGTINFGTQAGNFGTNDFTVEFWLKTTSQQQQALLFKREGCYYQSLWNIRMTPSGGIQVEFCQDYTGSNYQTFWIMAAPLNNGTFHHLALTRCGYLTSVYQDGLLAGDNFASAVAMLSNNIPLYAGLSPCPEDNLFAGILDEIAIFNRALSPAEIQAVYQSSTNGMCAPSPIPCFLAPPLPDQAVSPGAYASFTALAECCVPFTYQWLKNSQPIPGANGPTLGFGPIGLADAGQYSVVISNQFGEVFSRMAALSVTPDPNTNCAVSPPSGMVSWWAGQLNPSDRAGTNNATLQGGASYAAGEVGSGFFLDGVTGAIDFGNQVGNFGTNDFTIDFWLQTQSMRQEAILSMRDCCCYASFWNIFANGGCIQFEYCNDGSGSIYQNFAAGGQRINDGLFHHVAVTRSNVYSKIYVDGWAWARSTASGVIILSNNVPCYAANSPCPGLNPFTGVLDEIQIYDRALSPAEIQAIYAAGDNGICPITPLSFTGAPSYSKTNGIVVNASLRSGQSYQIQANTNLASTNWIALTNFTAGTAPIFCFTNKPPTNIPQQFFRIVTP